MTKQEKDLLRRALIIITEAVTVHKMPVSQEVDDVCNQIIKETS